MSADRYESDPNQWKSEARNSRNSQKSRPSEVKAPYASRHDYDDSRGEASRVARQDSHAMAMSYGTLRSSPAYSLEISPAPSSSLPLRQKPVDVKKGLIPVMARNVERIMNSPDFLICYCVNNSSESSGGNSKGSGTLSGETLIKRFVRTNSHSDILGTITDYREYLICFARSTKKMPENVAGQDGIMLVKFATLRWQDLLKLLHCLETPKHDTEKQKGLRILNFLVRSQWRSMGDPNTTKVGLLPVLEVRPAQVRTQDSSSAGRKGLDSVMRSFLEEHPHGLRNLETYLKGLRVEVQNKKDEHIPRYSRTITGLARPADGLGSKALLGPPHVKYGGGSQDVSFYFNPNGKGDRIANGELKSHKAEYMTVARYFEERRKQPIDDTKLPVINVGTRSKPTYVPPELCLLQVQQTSKASVLSVGDLWDIASTANSTGQVKNRDGTSPLRYAGLRYPVADALPDCQVRVTTKVILIPGRTKPEPMIQYTFGKQVKTESRSRGAGSVASIARESSTKVGVLIVGPSSPARSEEVSKKLRVLQDRLVQLGFSCERSFTSPTVVALDCRELSREVRLEIGTRLKSVAQHADVVVVVLPSKMQSLYDYVKRQSDIVLGISTVCVLAPRLKASKNINGYFSHVALKLHLMNGGQNKVIKSSRNTVFSPETTMIVGLDTLTPPKGTESGARGVAAVVASSASNLSQWPAEFQVLGSRPLHEAFSDLLRGRCNLWERGNKRKLKNVIIYYNGSTACPDDVASFREACGVNMTLITVKKAHGAALETLPSGEGGEKQPTASAAIIVRSDHGVQWDFIVQGQKREKPDKISSNPQEKSTILPVRYSVVHDSIFIPADAKEELEDLTHDMCYLSGCSSSVVSKTLPLHYVKLLCDRLRSYMRPWYHPKDKDHPKKSMTQDSVQVHESIMDTMFYV